ncbi:MAG TPA: glycoside hydrolase family 3 C-terminal domain-containing protein [Chthoniobacterales bacterium]|nr:glycoside hydrolase family 3 C-terminal domain-containing protein [Chthoniobacterales bacterium]
MESLARLMRELSFLACVSTAFFLAFLGRADESVDQRLEKILGQMTLEEKLDYLGGINAMSIRPIPRLGLPEIRMSDGPLGVRQDKPSTRYPAGIALAASWNRDLAQREGVSIARDCRARGIHILLAPGVNINRLPICGRNFEYISGEDPYLASEMVVPFIRGVQSQGVTATVKHFSANNQEINRMTVNVIVPERALREIYLPAFEAAVRVAKVGAVMDAYNKVNGDYCTENNFINNLLLKGEWGFDGVLMSDWGATHSALGPARAGLDLEMPSGSWMNAKNLLPAIRRGEVTEQQIDDKVRRILRLIIRMGYLDRPQKDPSIPENDPESGKAALAIAEEGIVLLKNEKNVLPLDRAGIKRIAVLGPDAHPGVPSGWGSSYVNPYYAVSVLDGLKNHTGSGTSVDYFDVGVGNFGTSEFEHEDRPGDLAPGLRAEYFSNLAFADAPLIDRIDQRINFDWAGVDSVRGILPAQFTVRWTGMIQSNSSSLHVFRARADSGIRVYLDDKVIIDDWSEHAAHPDVTTRFLDAGRVYRLRVEYKNTGGGGAIAQFGWASLKVPEAIRDYDAAIVCVGFDNGNEGEGSDRTFGLPDGQDDLINGVADKNPKTIVVINSGGNVDMHRWLEKVPVLLHAWYPGQEGGNALAKILFGDVDPSAKLPVTFEADKNDNPAFESYPSDESSDINGENVHYDEGIFVGYRGYERLGIEPLFPFGFGLSYTRFEFSNLRIEQGDRPDLGNVQVSFEIRNIGDRAGAEVAQLYVSAVQPAVARPVKELKEFAKVFLLPGETKQTTLSLDRKSFAYFDSRTSQWRADPGGYVISIGASSRDLRLKQRIEITGANKD